MELAQQTDLTGTEHPYHQCPCGCSFQGHGDLTRHSLFCDGIGPVNPVRAEEIETFACPGVCLGVCVCV